MMEGTSPVSLHVTADDDRCVCSMQCSAVAPAVFGHDEDGIVVVIDARPPAELQESVRRAVRVCPSAAIEISED
ncbi:4Fe-4S domain-containing protein [Nocardia sp. R6R-6]|uniref:4Fe-4S domain-containing protein n=1 Tax=Nocardia sp. R6R-6 TaxID=3459303 RepID=UPI00403DD0C6